MKTASAIVARRVSGGTGNSPICRAATLVAGFALQIAALGVGPSVTTHAAQPPPAAPKNAVTLFNGRDLTGWKFFLKEPAETNTLWSVTDGVLHLVGKPNGYVRTEQNYANYRLHVEWRWPAGANPKSNSGVFVHVHGQDAVWPPGVEAQLAAGNAGQLVATDVDLPGAPTINNKQRAPKLAVSSEKSFGEWNTYEITCRGDAIDVVVNGVHQNHVAKISVTAGAIGLQMEGYPIDFKNLWLERL